MAVSTKIPDVSLMGYMCLKRTLNARLCYSGFVAKCFILLI